MRGENTGSHNVDQFLFDQIDTVPHLEALLLLWNRRPASWPAERMAEALFLAPESAKVILDDLVRRRLLALIPGSPECYRYEGDPDRDALIHEVDLAYRKELIRISRLIHSKPSAALRAFASAFRIKKDKE